MCHLLLDVSECEDQGCHFRHNADLALFLRKSELTEYNIEAISRFKNFDFGGFNLEVCAQACLKV